MGRVPPEVIARLVETLLKASKMGEKLSISKISERSLLSQELIREILFSWGILEDVLDLTGDMKFDVVVKAMELGVEGEKISRYLNWIEFEQLVAKIFEKAGYQTVWNIGLIHRGHRCQVDLLAYRGNLVLVIDCKHWKRPIPPSASSKIVEAQEKRLAVLRDKFKSQLKVGEESREIYLIPIVLSLYQPSRKIVDGHIFASVGKLRGLLEYIESAYFQVRHEKMKVPKEQDFRTLLRMSS